jgi:hypothetical protein
MNSAFVTEVMTTTPPQIDGEVRAFCSEINSKSNPTYVKVTPRDFALPRECFYNVRTAIESFGGQFAYGWTIWLWPNVLIEAEHHAVWKTPSGRLIDVTPKAEGERKIVFLQDDSATYDFEIDVQRDSVRKPLVEDPDVAQWLKLAADSFSIMKSNRTGEVVNVTPELLLVERHRAVLLQRLQNRYPAHIARRRKRAN